MDRSEAEGSKVGKDDQAGNRSSSVADDEQDQEDKDYGYNHIVEYNKCGNSSDEGEQGPQLVRLDAEHMLAYLQQKELSAFHRWMHNDPDSEPGEEPANRNSPPDCWHSLIHHWTDRDYERILRSAKRDRHTTHVTLDVGDMAHWKAVRRTADVLSRWQNLTHLDIQCFDEDEVLSCRLMVKYTDALLERLVETSGATLQSLKLWAVGYPGLWESLVKRFGARVTSLTLADRAKGEPLRTNEPALYQVIDSTYHQWIALRTIELHLGLTSTSVTPLQGLATVPNLQKATFRIGVSAEQCLRAVVEEVARCISLCRSLQILVVEAPELETVFNGYPFDLSSCLESAASSRSLQDLEFRHASLTPSQEKSIPTNLTLRTLVLDRVASLESSTCNVLSNFHGLQVLVMNAPSVHDSSESRPMHRFPEVWELLLRQHPQLHTLEYYAADCPSYINQDAILAAIGRGLQDHPAMRRLHLPVRGGENELHSLTTLLQTCQGTLQLRLQHSWTIDHLDLSRGVEHTHASLLHLDIIADSLELDALIALFCALRHNRSLRHFELECDCRLRDELHVAAFEHALSATLVNNATLTTLRVLLGHAEIACDLNKRLLNALLVGLGINRTLQVLRFGSDRSFSTEAAMRVVQMLERNTSLRKYDGFSCELESDRAKVERYLTLNRYGRRLILDSPATASPFVSLGLWPRVLAPIVADGDMDALFYFLKRLPLSVFQRGTARALHQTGRP